MAAEASTPAAAWPLPAARLIGPFCRAVGRSARSRSARAPAYRDGSANDLEVEDRRAECAHQPHPDGQQHFRSARGGDVPEVDHVGVTQALQQGGDGRLCLARRCPTRTPNDRRRPAVSDRPSTTPSSCSAISPPAPRGRRAGSARPANRCCSPTGTAGSPARNPADWRCRSAPCHAGCPRRPRSAPPGTRCRRSRSARPRRVSRPARTSPSVTSGCSACQLANGGLPMPSGSVRAVVAAGSRVPTVTLWPSSVSRAAIVLPTDPGSDDTDLHGILSSSRAIDRQVCLPRRER